jgi:hypothetical protein
MAHVTRARLLFPQSRPGTPSQPPGSSASARPRRTAAARRWLSPRASRRQARSQRMPVTSEVAIDYAASTLLMFAAVGAQ